MSIFLLLDGAARVVVRVHQLRRKFVCHLSFASLSGVDNQPADRKRLTAFRADFNGHLIVGAADTASLNLHNGHDVFHRLLEYVHRVLIEFLPRDFKGVVNDRLRRAFFTVEHNLIDEFRNDFASVHRIGQNVSLGNITSSGHDINPPLIILSVRVLPLVQLSHAAFFLRRKSAEARTRANLPRIFRRVIIASRAFPPCLRLPYLQRFRAPVPRAVYIIITHGAPEPSGTMFFTRISAYCLLYFGQSFESIFRITSSFCYSLFCFASILNDKA